MITLLIISAVPLLFLLWVLITYLEHLISLRKYPKGPFPLPLIGNLNLIGGQKLHLKLIELSKKYGDVYSISMGMRRVVVVNSYENVKEGLITRGHDLAGRPHLRVGSKYHSNNYKTVGTMDYSKSWAFVRKLAYKSLHLYGEGMAKMEEIVLDNVEKLSRIINKEAGQPAFIHQYLGNILVNTICQRVFSTDYEIDDPEYQNILNFTFDIGKGLGLDGWTMVFPWLAHLPANASEELRHLIAAVKKRNAHTTKMFQQHISTFNPDNLRDICDQLLFLSQNKEQWQGAGFERVTQEQLEAIVHSYFFAGIETTLTTLRWFFLYCLHDPKHQTRMHQEIVDTFGTKHRLTYSDLSSLPFTQAMLSETNRHASILRIDLPHKAEVHSSIAGLEIPKGAPVLFNFHSVHYDEKYWEKPHEFKPERWLNVDGSLKKEKVTHYLPFSAGTRVCLGEKMAKVQMFLIAASLVRSFEVHPYPGEKLPGLDERGPGSGPYTPGSTYKVIFKQRSES